MRLIITGLIMLMLACGCENKCNDFVDNFTIIDSLDMNYDVLSGINFYQYHFDQRMKEDLLTFKKDNKIILINSNSRVVEFEINLDNLGDFVYRDHLYLNKDSVFICSILNKSEMFILLMKADGEIYQQWNINKLVKKNIAAYFYIDSRYAHPMTFIQNKLYFQASYKFKPGAYIGSGVPIEMVLDLQCNSGHQIGELPDEYQQGFFYGNQQWEYSRVINNKGELVFSFPISHDIYVFSESGQFIKATRCKSHFIDKFKPIGKNFTNDLSSIMDAYNYNAQYSELLYDRYNNQYLRIVLHNLGKFGENGKIIDFNTRPWSVMVLDENLQLIKEVLMPGNNFWKRLVISDQALMLKPTGNDDSNEIQVYKFQPCLH